MNKCIIHPKYKGVKEPRVKNSIENCSCSCWRIYLENHPDKKYPNFISGKLMSYNDWRNAGKESASRLLKALADPTGLTPF